MSSKRYPSRLESRAGFFASTRDECLPPRVRLECNPEIPVAPGEEHWLLAVHVIGLPAHTDVNESADSGFGGLLRNRLIPDELEYGAGQIPAQKEPFLKPQNFTVFRNP